MNNNSATYIKIKMPKKGNLPKGHRSVSQNVLLSIDFGNFNTKAKMCEQMAICMIGRVPISASRLKLEALSLVKKQFFLCFSSAHYPPKPPSVRLPA